MESIKEVDLIIILLIGTLVMVIMATIVVYYVVSYQKKVLKQKEEINAVEKKFQNELLTATILVAERERTMIAKNIHDDIGVLINVIKMNNNELKQTGIKTLQTNKIIETNNQLATEVYDNIRLIYNDLMSPTLVKLGLIRALEQFCNQLNNSNIIKVKLNSNGLNWRLEINEEIQLFRVCKEVIHNIIKHGKSTQLEIDVEMNREVLKVMLRYNGVGINDADVRNIIKNSEGIGLKSLMGRIQALNGSINYIAEQDQNPHILISIPRK